MDSGDSIGPRRLMEVWNFFANAVFWMSAGVNMPRGACCVSVVGAVTYRCGEQLTSICVLQRRPLAISSGKPA